MLKEFREFAVKGSLIEFAVGISIGAAFNSVVSSLVKDVIMPPIGWLIGRTDFASLYVNLGFQKYNSLQAAQAAGAPTVNYGSFLNELVALLLVVWVIFFIVKFINRLRREKEKGDTPDSITRPCPYCTNEIAQKATRCPYCTAEIEANL
ncbi:large conductance mechanosensitive channel protein MscL [Idiomarina seosinensis]|uniref:Large-conductance mechanosensitive channel n=1 Tax=Idiomarina seosinensis TaxID=281739 RepID=A0A432ZEF1_9GAMM|nr:large conductance mechanosensitive channel protein MscL [Idiomarina seosinensis]